MNFLQKLFRTKTQRAFDKYVPRELLLQTISKIQAGWLPEKTFGPRHFQFVLVHIADTTIEDVPAIISNVVDVFFRQKATLFEASSSLVVGCFGVPDPQSDSTEARLNLVSALLAENYHAIRVAHGECNGLAGNFGPEPRFIYRVLIPNYAEILKKLFDAPLGTSIEVP